MLLLISAFQFPLSFLVRPTLVTFLLLLHFLLLPEFLTLPLSTLSPAFAVLVVMFFLLFQLSCETMIWHNLDTGGVIKGNH